MTTPRPWTYNATTDTLEGDGFIIAENFQYHYPDSSRREFSEIQRKNVEFLLCAVNSFDAMKAALEKALPLIGCEPVVETGIGMVLDTYSINAVTEQIKQALTLAEGKE